MYHFQFLGSMTSCGFRFRDVEKQEAGEEVVTGTKPFWPSLICPKAKREQANVNVNRLLRKESTGR